jgi:RNA polymerase sigma-70 factor (ECF subfamily)
MATDAPIRLRDPATFDEIVREHRAAVYGYVRSRTSSIADAEALTQQVFASLYRNAKHAAAEPDLRAWLLNAARDALIGYVAAHHKLGGTAWSELCLEIDPRAPHDPPAVEQQRIRECLDHLEPSAREALQFKYSGQRSLAEVSRRMRRSEEAIKLLIYRARQSLRQHVEQASERQGDGE